MMIRTGKKILKLRETPSSGTSFTLQKNCEIVKKMTGWCAQAFLSSGPKPHDIGSAKKDQT